MSSSNFETIKQLFHALDDAKTTPVVIYKSVEGFNDDNSKEFNETGEIQGHRVFSGNGVTVLLMTFGSSDYAQHFVYIGQCEDVFSFDEDDNEISASVVDDENFVIGLRCFDLSSANKLFLDSVQAVLNLDYIW